MSSLPNSSTHMLIHHYRLIPHIRQILLFSATFPDDVMRYAEQFSPNANQIKLRREDLTVSGIKQMFIDCPADDRKYDILVALYGMMTIGSSIIFVKVCERIIY